MNMERDKGFESEMQLIFRERDSLPPLFKHFGFQHRATSLKKAK